MRRRAKTDRNHADVMKWFRQLGWSVRSTHQLGGGFPDMVIGRDGINYIIEVKDGEAPPSDRRLTPDEVKFFDEWRGQKCIVESQDDVIRFHELHMDKVLRASPALRSDAPVSER